MALNKMCMLACAVSAILLAPAMAHAKSFDGTVIRTSYYSHGSITADGERFNPDGFTAAHRTLPFGTRLKVSDVKTGRSVVVRINDRGPFVRGRSLDLSRGAAAALGILGAGTAIVRISKVA